MSQEKTEAVVLRGVDFSETSRIVTFLTPDRGRISCIAKGARRKNSRLGPVLDTFNRVELIYYHKEGRQVQTLAEASLLDGFFRIKQDLEGGVYAGLVLEMAYKAAREEEPSLPLYIALLRGLTNLSMWSGDVRTHISWQIMQLLTAAGYTPELFQCIHCGASVSAASGFDLSGGVSCAHCRRNLRLTEPVWTALKAFSTADSQCPEIEMAPETFTLLCKYARHQLETDFRSLRVLHDMFG